MDKIALATVFFDYPEYYKPSFYNNALKYFKPEDIHIARFNGLIKTDSYYEKLYKYKVLFFSDYVKKNILGKYEYILFLDATDTNFYRDPQDIISKFEEFKSNIVFCAEKGFWPPINEKNLYDNKEKLTDTFYLNSGLYLGYTDKIASHMDSIIANNRTPYDDQGHWTIEYLLNEDIKVDQERKLFFSTYEAKEFVHLNEGKPHIGCNPYVIHDNGPHTENTIKLTQLL
jgi:hypothetical protein